jgi:uncharacterized DUF497 family protein
VEFEWDPEKAASNLAKHGVSFEMAHTFDWETAILVPDQRRDYGEDRSLAFDRATDGEMYVVAFTVRHRRFRIISMRPFGRKEYQLYGR